MRQQRERTITSIFNLWFWNFQNPSLQQYSNLYHSTICLLEFFAKEKPDYVTTKLLIKKLFFHPILELTQKYPEMNISKNVVDWDIAKIEQVVYRGSHFATKLGEEYFVDSSKPQESKKVFFGELLTVVSLIKLELAQIAVKIMLENDVALDFEFLKGAQAIEQLRSDVVE